MVDLAERSMPYNEALVSSLCEDGERVQLLHRNQTSGDWRYMRFIRHSPNSRGKLRKSLKFIELLVNHLKLYRWLLKQQACVVHFQWLPLLEKTSLDLYSVKKLQKRGHKVVYTVHNLLPHDTGERLKNRFLKIYHESDHLICHSQSALDALSRDFSVMSDKVSVIPHGTLYDERLNDEVVKKPNSCLFFGFLRPYKGIEFLLDAWRLVESQSTNHSLTIVGKAERNYEMQLIKKVKELELRRVQIINKYQTSEELQRNVLIHEVILYPYSSITTSGALTVAMSAGKPVIATNLPAFNELIVPGKNGVLVEYGDVRSLSDNVLRLLSDSVFQAELGNNAREMTQDVFSWKSISRATRYVYDN